MPLNEAAILANEENLWLGPLSRFSRRRCMFSLLPDFDRKGALKFGS